MKGSIRTRTLASGKPIYDALYRSPSGQQKGKSFTRRKDAEKYLAETVVSVNSGTYRDVTPVTFKAFAPEWLKGLGNLKPSTTRVYGNIIAVHLVPYFGDRVLHSITVADVNSYLATRDAAGCKPKTARNELALLNKVLADAREAHHLTVHPLSGSKALRRPRAVRAEDCEEATTIFEPAELNRLLDAVVPHYAAYVLTAISTGMRPGEVIGLQFGDIDFEKRVIHVRRTFWKDTDYVLKTKGSRRAVDVGDQLLGTLRHLGRERFGAEAVPPEAPIFVTPGGSRINVDNFLNRVWRPALAKAGLHYRRPYSLRHTYASLLLAQGQSIRYVSSQMGHSSPVMTLNVYARFLPQERREAPTRFEAQLQAARDEMPSMTSEAQE